MNLSEEQKAFRSAVRQLAEERIAPRAAEVDATPAQVGLAWLLAHAPNMLLIAGTKSINHLEENIAAGDVALSADQLARLDSVSTPNASPPAHGIEAFVDEA